ncbi:23624_t:CDS:2 [Dentiscutata erythropus]|uniref:23624_t:CDS:1 n=1 Tax=Dentiscutata erythropus TaxID=1348616 RepID=A0A9N8Z8X5_9GLOM|nr:23624_t:CDS:2 [Dentiscutata erythropus]
MKAIVISKLLEAIDELEVDQNAPEPELKENQVLIEIKASALNYFDILQSQERYQIKPSLPFILGSEFAGVIIAVHPTVNNKYKPGDKIFGYGQGSFAERIAIDIQAILLIPDGMSFEEASGLFITCPTSYTALVIRAKLQKDEWCLVHAAAGGVGIAAVQIAKALGAKVIATCGSNDKLAFAKKFGADYGVNYNDKDWQKQVLQITGKRGVDVVFDPVGLVQASLKFIAWSGRILVVGFAGIGNSFEKLFAEKKLKPVIYKNVYHGLHNVKYGLKAIANRETYGKVVVIPNVGRDSKI